jgi:toxin CcdB
MAWFDVHADTGQNWTAIPYVVVFQSMRFDNARTRVVAGLRLAPNRAVADPTLTPRFRIEGKNVMLDPLQILAIAQSSLGRSVASLADEVSSSAIINAID